jgi:hypothetical protein
MRRWRMAASRWFLNRPTSSGGKAGWRRSSARSATASSMRSAKQVRETVVESQPVCTASPVPIPSSASASSGPLRLLEPPSRACPVRTANPAEESGRSASAASSTTDTVTRGNRLIRATLTPIPLGREDETTGGNSKGLTGPGSGAADRFGEMGTRALTTHLPGHRSGGLGCQAPGTRTRGLPPGSGSRPSPALPPN